MPILTGLGLVESCILTINVGYQTSGRRDLPRFGALVEVITVRPTCLILIMNGTDFNGAADKLGGVFDEGQGG
jgi:hypothetical protein